MKLKLELSQAEYDFLIKVMLQQIELVAQMKTKLPEASALNKAEDFTYELFKKINEAKK